MKHVSMRLHVTKLAAHFSTALWPVPTAAMVGAMGLAKLLVLVDRHISHDRKAWYFFRGQADSARELLSTIASAMLTLTGLVFSITILVLQLASSQFSPRVLRTFLHDRIAKLALGTFVGSFVYSMALLPEVLASTDERSEFVPQLAVFTAFVLVLFSVAVFIRYIHHQAQSIRAVHVISRVADEGAQSLQALFPEGVLQDAPEPRGRPEPPPTQEIQSERRGGVVLSVSEDELMKLALDHDAFIAMAPQIGDFVPRGAVLFHVWGNVPRERLLECVAMDDERTPDQDAAFAFRQLVDVAERALSPGINDPTTAVQCIDRIHDLLRSLAIRQIPSPLRADDAGKPRLWLPRPDWAAYVNLAVDEIRHYGVSSIQVARRLEALLRDLLAIAPPARRPALEEQVRRLRNGVRRNFEEPAEWSLAHEPSTQGHGPVRSGEELG